MLIVAVDANFRLKNLFRSTEQKDPGLHTGLAYFVDEKPYKEHVMKFATQKDVGGAHTCICFVPDTSFRSAHAAVSKVLPTLTANSMPVFVARGSPCVFAPATSSYAQMVLEICRRANGVLFCVSLVSDNADVGYDSYCNIDFILLCALFPLGILSLFISYDIACQYRKNFETRMDELPEDLLIPEDVEIQWGVPKAHNPAHKLACQAPYSLNLKVVGRTDGEAPERSWSESNLVANSTKEMGPGSRHDTIDDHLGHHNWKKTCGLGAFVSLLSQEHVLTVV